MAPAFDARREGLGRSSSGIFHAAEDQALESVEVALGVAASSDAQAVGFDADVGHHGLPDLRAVRDGDAGQTQKVADRVRAALPLAATQSTTKRSWVDRWVARVLRGECEGC